MPCRWDGDAVSRFDINLISYTYMCVYIYTHHREIYIYIYYIYSICIYTHIDTRYRYSSRRVMHTLLGTGAAGDGA